LNTTAPVSVYENPRLVEAVGVIRETLSKHITVFVSGRCRVEYEGRASSTLDWGERIIIIKADGSVLVHRPVGYEPVNWQPPKCLFQTELTSEGNLKIKAVRRRPRESISIFFDKVYLVAVLDLVDSGEFALHASESQMKEAILIKPSLVEKGFRPISHEKDLGESGFVDVFGEDVGGNFVVVEIKRNPIGKDAILQLNRYIESIKKRVNRPVRGMVVGPELRKGVQPLLERLKLEYRQLLPQKCFEALKKLRVRKISEFFS
jgi:RecB family endonuclease NucS